MRLPIPSTEAFAQATPEELAEYAAPALERLPREYLPPQAFMPIRERIRGNTLDIVSFRAGTDGNQVLIGQRGHQAGDRWWTDRLNIPGSLLLPTEVLKPTNLQMADGRPLRSKARYSFDITSPVDRILGKEFRGSIRRVAPVNELMHYFVDVDTIAEHKITAWTEVEIADGHEEVIAGAFYDTQTVIDNPPEKLVEDHEYFIERALLALQARR